METLVTNVEKEVQANRNYAVYGPLTSDIRFILNNDKEWKGLSAMQKLTPVCLTSPHEEAKIVCIVGKKIIWSNKVSIEFKKLEPALLRFVKNIGLNFLELSLAKTENGIRVITVEPYPFYEHFNETVGQKIADEIVQLLISEKVYKKKVIQLSQRSYS